MNFITQILSEYYSAPPKQAKNVNQLDFEYICLVQQMIEGAIISSQEKQDINHKALDTVQKLNMFNTVQIQNNHKQSWSQQEWECAMKDCLNNSQFYAFNCKKLFNSSYNDPSQKNKQKTQNQNQPIQQVQNQNQSSSYNQHHHPLYKYQKQQQSVNSDNSSQNPIMAQLQEDVIPRRVEVNLKMQAKKSQESKIINLEKERMNTLQSYQNGFDSSKDFKLIGAEVSYYEDDSRRSSRSRSRSTSSSQQSLESYQNQKKKYKK